MNGSMNTVPTRHHAPGPAWLAATSVAVMTVLFLLFERGFMWLATLLVVVSLSPLIKSDWTPRQVHWRWFALVVVLAAGIVIWIT